MQRYRVVIMLVLFGVLPVVAAFFVALSFLEEQEEESTQAETAPAVEEVAAPEPPEMREVLVAARALPVGTLLGKDDLTTLVLEQTAIRKEHVVVTDDMNADSWRGYAVREALAEGALFTQSAVVGPEERGFLSAALQPGARAVTIRVGEATGHAALVEPGDRVDVILSADLAVDGGDRRTFVRTIVEDVRVVAIDRRTKSQAGFSLGDITPTAITTVTLEASRAQGNRLVLGDHEGTLSLAMRSLATAQTSDETTALDAVDLRELLLSSSEFSASEIRQQHEQELLDLDTRTRLVESREKLRAAVEAGASTQEAVRIFRGSNAAEEVVFPRR